MTSYVFTILNKKYYWNKVYESLTQKYGKHFELVLVLKKSNKEAEEILKLSAENSRVRAVLVDDESSENDMVSAGIKEVKGKEMVLCRDYFDYKTILSDYMVAMGYKGAQVVLYRKIKKQSKIKTFFSNIYNKAIRQVFGFKLYGSEIGLAYFNNIALSVLKELPNNSVLTKVNKWAAFEISYIDIDKEDISEPKLEKSENKSVLTKIIIYSTLSALLIAGFVVLLAFKKLSFILGMFFVFMFLMILFMLAYNSLKYTIIDKYGNLR